MKRLLVSMLIMAGAIQTYAQCTVVPFSLKKRVYESDVVVEAKVVGKNSFWNDDKNYIYTNNRLEVSTLFKGENVTQYINLITEGGLVGLDALVVEPSLQLQVNEVGIFLLKKSMLTFQSTLKAFQPVASVQSFVKYDLLERTAHGYFEVYENIADVLFPQIEKYASQKAIRTGKNPLGVSSIRPLATPVISSLDKDTVTGGTSNVLTISGSNFGIIKGKGYVEFLDPNYGDGRFFPVFYPTSYKSWSNTKIEVYVPARAGTGNIRVINNSAESSTSSSEIYVRFAHSNYGFGGGSGADSGFYKPKHVNVSGNGGYRWQMTHNFAKRTDAVNAFFRAAENWRCSTLMNWDVGNDTTAAGAVKDNINVVQFTRFGDSRLGVCASWYSGCVSSGIAYFHVSELDISFDSTRNWYYGTSNPGTSQYDFETVATHELGHGHQLSHVIDNTKIMHYSLKNGDRNVTLHKHDIEGGSYVREQSKTGTKCFSSNYTPIAASDCNITKPKAGIAANIGTPCPGTTIRLTDISEGKITTYAWTFGDDASTASASGSGPYNISYSTSGDKVVRLIVTNDFGSDTANFVVRVQPGTPDAPTAFSVDTACIGSELYTVDTLADGTSTVLWALGSGGAISGSNTNRTVTINWTTTGEHVLSVVGKNVCGTSVPLNTPITVIDVAVADFSVIDDGLDVFLTDLSSSASSWRWKFDDGDSSNEKDPKHRYDKRGTYSITLTASNACSDSTVSKSVDVEFRVGLNDVRMEDIRLMPNPTRNFVRLTQSKNLVNVLITNNIGQVVYEKSNISSNQIIDVSDLVQGVYFYTLETNDGQTYTGKLVKE